MAELTTEQLKEYLKEVTELESSVYCQKATIRRSRANLKTGTMRPFHEREPERKTHGMGFAEHMEQSKDEKTRSEAWISAMICGIFGFILIFAAINGSYTVSVWGDITWDFTSVTFVFIGIGVAIIAIGILYAISKYRKYDNKIKEREASVKRIQDQYDREYETAMQEYNQRKQAYEEERRTYLELSQKKLELATLEVNKMDAPLAETEELLEKLYTMDIIFPKYRNFVAVSTIYEYILSGRCVSLTGPDGAYNLYESELRQNLIINKMDQIIKNLELIRNNQYMLYTELNKMNATIKDISYDIHEICDTTKDIAYSTHMTAYFAQITAKNTEAIKYISLING